MAKTPKNPPAPAPVTLPQSGGCFEIMDGVLRAAASDDALLADAEQDEPTSEPAATTLSTEA
jgi:hypothetical protein